MIEAADPGRVLQPAPDAFDTLFAVEHPKLFALALALTGDRESARDIAQETLTRAFQMWPEVSRLDRPGAWARRVAIHLSADWHRRSRRDRALLGRLSRHRVGLVEASEAVDDAFWREVRRLPPRQRAAIALHYLEDLSIDDVAGVLEIAPGTVKASLFKARQSLAGRLAVKEES